MSKTKMYFRMILASFMRRRSRMLVALLAVAIGATILSGLVTIYYDVPRQMGAEFRNYGANMILTPTEEDFTSEDLQAAVDVVASSDLVGATPFRYESVRIHEQPIMAAGTDMAAIQKTSPYWSVEGDWASESGQILVGADIAENLGLTVGESLTMSYAPEDADEETLDNEIELDVCGIVSTGGSEEDYVYISMEDMETLTEITGVIDLAEVSITTTTDSLNSYMDKINETVPAVNSRLVKRVTASETTVLSKLQALVLLVTIVVLALTMICVATTMTAVVSERRKEIGLRKAIGASDAELVKEFLGEGLVLGGFGGLLGAFLGFAFAQSVSVNVFSSSISLRPALVPITILVSMAVTGVACLLPIQSATKVDPALVLKGE